MVEVKRRWSLLLKTYCCQSEKPMNFARDRRQILDVERQDVRMESYS